MIMGFPDAMGLNAMPTHHTGSGNFNMVMVAAKTYVGPTYISACRQVRIVVSMAKLMFLGFLDSMDSMRPNAKLCNHTGSGKSNMAAPKRKYFCLSLQTIYERGPQINR